MGEDFADSTQVTRPLPARPSTGRTTGAPARSRRNWKEQPGDFIVGEIRYFLFHSLAETLPITPITHTLVSHKLLGYINVIFRAQVLIENRAKRNIGSSL